MSYFSNMGDEQKSALSSGLMNLGGSIVQGVGQAGDSQKQNALGREQTYLGAANNAEAMQLQRGNQDLQRQQMALQASQADPLRQQKSRQQAALFAAILPGLRNAQVTSQIPGMSQFIPQMQGGFRIPEGGFDAATLQMFNPESRVQAEANFYDANRNSMRAPNLDQLGYGSSNGSNGLSVGFGATQGAQGAYDEGQQGLQRQSSEAQARQQAIMQILAQAQQRAGDATKPDKHGGLKAALGTGISLLPLLFGG